MSVLAHVIDRGELAAEPAATQALAYILNSSPDIAKAFVGVLPDENIEYAPERIEAELEYGEARPDLTLHDSDNRPRIFVENKFWAGLTDAQPVAYLETLKKLSKGHPSALIFVVPEQRVSTVWNELKARCSEAGLEWTEPPDGEAVRWVRMGRRTMAIASWSHILERLLDVARSKGHEDLARDILQLRGLASREGLKAFLPLRVDEVTDQETARRMLNYIELIDDIIEELKRTKVADTHELSRTRYYAPHVTGRRFNVYAHKKFESSLQINLRAWRREGISPMWWRFEKKTGVVADHFMAIPELFKDVKIRYGGLNVPIRLKTGVERDRVIGDAVVQMKRIVNQVLTTIPNK